MNDYIKIIKEISNNERYLKRYLKIINRGLSRTNTRSAAEELFGYTEKHHIVPKSLELGGKYDDDNLVYLSAREHFIAHWILSKLFAKGTTYYGKMIHALDKMSRQSKTNKRYYTKITSRVFEHNKIALREVRGRPCIINGVRYATAVIAARAIDIKASTLIARIRSGSFEAYYWEDSPKTTKEAHSRSIVVDGVLYNSLPKAAAELGLPGNVLFNRLNSKFDMECYRPHKPKQDPGPLIKGSPREVSIDGILYPSVTDARNKTKIPNLTEKLRASEFPEYFYTDGKTEKKLIRSLNNRYKILMEVDGILYESVSDACKQLNVERREILRRAKDINYPTFIIDGVEKIDLKQHIYEQPGNSVVVNGIVYKTISEAARIHNISRQTLKGRLKSKFWVNWYYENKPKGNAGITRKESFAQAVGTRVLIDGIIYASISTAARELNLTRDQVVYRINSANYSNYTRLTTLTAG